MARTVDHSWNVAACPIPVVANPGSRKVVEIGAKLMRALPHEHQSKILQVISSHVMGLQSSDFDVQQAILVLQSEMAELKAKNAAFEKSIGLSNSNYQNVPSSSPFFDHIGR